MIIKEFLSAIQQGYIFSREVGLCSNYTCFCLDHGLDQEAAYLESDRLRKLMMQFPKYTGFPFFPLIKPDDYREHVYRQTDFYERGTPWGDIRAEFVEWALNKLAQN